MSAFRLALLAGARVSHWPAVRGGTVAVIVGPTIGSGQSQQLGDSAVSGTILRLRQGSRFLVLQLTVILAEEVIQLGE